MEGDVGVKEVSLVGEGMRRGGEAELSRQR